MSTVTRKARHRGRILLLGCLIFLHCASAVRATEGMGTDPLPSWNQGPSKAAIVAFVQRVTAPGGQEFVPIPERVAVFDNDGTLWPEQPVPVQFAFLIDQVKAVAPRFPGWKVKQPFQAAIEGDLESLGASGAEGLLQLVMATSSGMTSEQFERLVANWLSTARHARFHRPYTDLAYRPMTELLAYLRANGFKTWIVSGSGVDFMRPWTEKVYGIPPEQVIGSSIKTTLEMAGGRPILVRLPEVEFINNRATKPVGIHNHIGRRPVFAVGNSDGDLQMLQWTAAGPGPRFALVIRHTDAQREWAYDRHSKIGRLDKALSEATKRGWTVVDMHREWKRVFAFEN